VGGESGRGLGMAIEGKIVLPLFASSHHIFLFSRGSVSAESEISMGPLGTVETLLTCKCRTRSFPHSSL